MELAARRGPLANEPSAARGLEVRVLCRASLARGFELAGLAVVRVEPDGRAADALRVLARDARIGVVLVEDDVRRALPDDLVQRIDAQASPLLVPFPSPAWHGRGVAEEYVLAILRQAVGYRVRPR